MSAETESVVVARQRLARVRARIAEHPLSSPEFLQARAVVAELADQDRAHVDAVLAERGLPGSGKQVRMMVVGLTSLARLNRRRLRAEQELARLEAESAG